MSCPKTERAPYYVVLAERFIDDQQAGPIEIADLLRVTGVSRRTLYEGFRRHRNTTPMAVVRRTQLERIRAELIALDPGKTSVADVAHRWGVNHLGRLAARYRSVFGENPSTTLRRVPPRVRPKQSKP